ncbi:xanthine dehydrogenase family protein subunit M [Neobacillus mesonae]|uniref:FAD binding domain-containing protein n=1 Tax=Neobacillus mesonae TaxID=1193713 RepID=UPI00203F4100|nr:FAD binding domain-containing protein [Neobacillus mesonae]MCM3566922.1 FAD binding domain-containing protein [Neobacillus mesonae]
MIPFDFEYYRPESLTEAVQTYETLISQSKTVLYYSGGTEFLTFSRVNQLYADAIIDLKGIPECNVLELQEDQLVIGSAVSLNNITESNLYPLLGQTVKKIADHTSRNKISIGGNLHSRLIYREAVLPLLVADATVKLTGNDGETVHPLKDLFNQELKINPGQFIVQINISKDYTTLPFVSLKKTKISKVGYPVVSIAALVKERQIRAALSGVCPYPFRSSEIESVLNNSSLTKEEKIEKAGTLLPSPIIEDIQASRDYREFVFKNTLLETLEALEAAQA